MTQWTRHDMTDGRSTSVVRSRRERRLRATLAANAALGESRLRGHRGKVRQQLQAVLLTLLGVKLSCPHVAAPDRRHELSAVIALGDDDTAIRRHHVIAVDE